MVRGASVASTSSKPPSSSRATGSVSAPLKISAKRSRTGQSDTEISDILPKRHADSSAVIRNGKGKGKAREDTTDIELELDDEQETDPKRGTNSKREWELRKELDSMKERAEQAETMRDSLRKQMEALLSKRTTEAEEIAMKKEEWFEERYRIDQETIAELRKLASSATDADKTKGKSKQVDNLEDTVESLQAELLLLKQSKKEQDLQLDRKDGTIQHLREELTRQRAIQPPGSASKGRTNAKAIAPEPIHTKVLKLYEDLTRISVLNIENFPNGELAFKCMATVPESQRSLAFKLTFLRHAPESPVQSDLIQYEPTSVKQETDQEMLDALGFLREPFQFQTTQLYTFMKNLCDRLSGEVDDESGDEAQDSP